MDIYVLKNGKKLGPWDKKAVRKMVSDGHFTGKDFAWGEGMAEPRPLEELLNEADSNAKGPLPLPINSSPESSPPRPPPLPPAIKIPISSPSRMSNSKIFALIIVGFLVLAVVVSSLLHINDEPVQQIQSQTRKHTPTPTDLRESETTDEQESRKATKDIVVINYTDISNFPQHVTIRDTECCFFIGSDLFHTIWYGDISSVEEQHENSDEFHTYPLTVYGKNQEGVAYEELCISLCSTADDARKIGIALDQAIRQWHQKFADLKSAAQYEGYEGGPANLDPLQQDTHLGDAEATRRAWEEYVRILTTTEKTLESADLDQMDSAQTTPDFSQDPYGAYARAPGLSTAGKVTVINSGFSRIAKISRKGIDPDFAKYLDYHPKEEQLELHRMANVKSRDEAEDIIVKTRSLGEKEEKMRETLARRYGGEFTKRATGSTSTSETTPQPAAPSAPEVSAEPEVAEPTTIQPPSTEEKDLSSMKAEIENRKVQKDTEFDRLQKWYSEGVLPQDESSYRAALAKAQYDEQEIEKMIETFNARKRSEK